MERHALDLKAICDDAELSRATFVGVSIGGYVLFEFWRQFKERVSALVLANTRAGADSPEAREGRRKSLDDIRQRGPVPFVDGMIPKLMGETTRRTRLDRVEVARTMMSQMTVAGLTSALQGLAERPDSTPTLSTISVPTLLIVGDEDTLTPVEEAQFMQRNLSRGTLRVIPRAGHYAAFEQPEDFARVLGKFLEESR
jgi:3-oxoadipate enol-lactonase